MPMAPGVLLCRGRRFGKLGGECGSRWGDDVRRALAMAFLSTTLGGPAWALEPCPPKFFAFGDAAAKVTCTCGPPRGLTLGLDELTEELGAPKPDYYGTLEQTIGGIYGTWTYTDESNVCKAAAHAGLYIDPDKGAKITVQGAPGCPSYEGSRQNGWLSYAAGASARSYFFPTLTQGRCPGEDGYADRYEGPPAFELLKQMASTSGLRVAHGAVEARNLETFTVPKLLITRPGSPPIAVERLSVTRIDMENVRRRFPPRFLTLKAEGVSLPTTLLPPEATALFAGQRIKLDLTLDLSFTLQSGRLSLNQLALDVVDWGVLDLRSEVLDLRPTVLNDPERGPDDIQPQWLRLRLDDKRLLAGLLPLLGEGGAAAVAQQLTAALGPASGAPRADALRPRLAAWLAAFAAPRGSLELYLQPAAGTRLGEILASSDFDSLVGRLNLAVAYDVPPPESPPWIDVGPAFRPPSEPLVVRFAGLPGKDQDWIAISYAGQPATSYQLYRYLHGQREGEVNFDRLESGIYEARLFFDGGTAIQAVTFFRVE